MKYKIKPRIKSALARRELEAEKWEKLAAEGNKEAAKKARIARSELENIRLKYNMQ